MTWLGGLSIDEIHARCAVRKWGAFYFSADRTIGEDNGVDSHCRYGMGYGGLVACQVVGNQWVTIANRGRRRSQRSTLASGTDARQTKGPNALVRRISERGDGGARWVVIGPSWHRAEAKGVGPRGLSAQGASGKKKQIWKFENG